MANAKPKRPSTKTPLRSAKPIIKTKSKEPMPKATKKTTPKRPVMPAKINPFKMTPAQKAEFLRNPRAYE